MTQNDFICVDHGEPAGFYVLLLTQCQQAVQELLVALQHLDECAKRESGKPLVALSQQDGVDLWQVMEQEQWLVVSGVTADLPAPDLNVAATVIDRASTGPSRAEILTAIQKRKVAVKGDNNRAGTATAAGLV